LGKKKKEIYEYKSNTCTGGVEMARIIPELDPGLIENEGERRVYLAARNLPKDYTVVYAYKFCDQITGAVIWQADLVIVHPFKGYIVLKIHPGEVALFNGRWHEFIQGGYREVKKDPIESARNAAYAVARSYKEKTGWNFPLNFDFGLCFPQCSKIQGQLPSYVRPASLLLSRDVENFTARIGEIFSTMPQRRDSAAIQRLIDNILTANFKLYNTLEDQIRSFADRAQHRFTEEQERILEETDLNKRMIFYGAAGTGKTMIAVEKARRLAESGKKVALTCFNKHLAGQFPTDVANLTARHFHGLLERVTGCRPPMQENDHYFEHTLPGEGYKYFSQLPQDQKYDALIVDEGQDFRPHWFKCMEEMVKKDGELYVFADSSQNIFKVDPSGLESLPASRFNRVICSPSPRIVSCPRFVSRLISLSLNLPTCSTPSTTRCLRSVRRSRLFKTRFCSITHSPPGPGNTG